MGQKASALLEEFSTANLPDKGLEQMSHDFHLRNEYSATPTDQGSSSMAPRAENSSAHIGYPVGNDLDNMVYPVGHKWNRPHQQRTYQQHTLLITCQRSTTRRGGHARDDVGGELCARPEEELGGFRLGDDKASNFASRG